MSALRKKTKKPFSDFRRPHSRHCSRTARRTAFARRKSVVYFSPTTKKNAMYSAKLINAAGGKLALFAIAMFGFGYALVPLYYKICEVTGINNLLNPQSYAADARTDENRELRLEFDTNARGLVAMNPNLRLIESAHPGETYSIIYTLENLSGRPLRAQAVPSFGPPRAGKWFRKIRCFCFDQLTLAPGEVRQEPVVFVVDADLPPDISVISLSYTFFEIEGGAPVPSSADG